MRRAALFVCLLVVTISIYFRCYRLFEAWSGGHNGWGGTVYGLIARNYVKFGYRETMLGPVLNAGAATRESFEFYYHHPPLQVWLMSVSYWIFGDHEFSARLVPLLFSLLSIALLSLFAKRYFGRDIALLATILIAVMPLEVYYAVHTDIYGSQAVFFSILGVYGYLRWLETGTRFDLGLLTTGIVLGCLTSWYSFFLIPPLLIHHWRARASVGRLWILPATAIAVFLLFLLHRDMLFKAGAAEQMRGLEESFLNRTVFPRLKDSQGQPMSAAATFVLLTLRWIGSMYTPVLAALTAAWLFLFARDSRRKEIQSRDWAVLFFLMMGTLHNLAFPNTLPPHHYMVAAYTPAIALGSAIVIHRGYCWAGANWNPRIASALLVAVVSISVAACGYGSWRLFREDNVTLGRKLRAQGNAIARSTRPTDTVFMPPIDKNQVKTLRYYADRNLIAGIDTAGQQTGNFVFVCEEDDVEQHEALIESLGRRQRHSIDGGLLFIPIQR